MDFDPEDSVQLGIYTFIATINDCDSLIPRERELATFLQDRMKAIQIANSNKEVLNQFALGSNAIISSLDGQAEWHEMALNVANMLLDGINEAQKEAGAVPIKKASFGEPLSTTLDEDTAWQQSSQALAQDPSTPIETLIELSEDNDWRVRSAVAENPSTPEELLRKLAYDPDEAIRSHVARNSVIPRDIMELLLADESEYVRDFLGQNVALPVDIMERLANDPHWRPRSGVAENQNAPVYLLNMLEQDPDERVADFARQNLSRQFPSF